MNKFPSYDFEGGNYWPIVFNSIMDKHGDMPKHYRADLMHDGAWVHEHVLEAEEPIKEFYWALRPSGTHIGTEADMFKQYNHVMYKIKVTQRRDYTVYVNAEQVQ